MKCNLRRLGNKGFTIVELMIATSILSVLLVTVTITMIGIGNLYYKGVSQSRLQDATRSVIDEVASHLELSTSGALVAPLATGAVPTAPGTVHAYCIGTVRYTYVLNSNVGGDDSGIPNAAAAQARLHALWRDTSSSGSCTPTANFPGNMGSQSGVELVPDGARLTSFDVPNSSTPYSVTLSMAYGSNDGTLTNGSGADTTCKGSRSGSPFCGTTILQTIVGRRLQ